MPCPGMGSASPMPRDRGLFPLAIIPRAKPWHEVSLPQRGIHPPCQSLAWAASISLHRGVSPWGLKGSTLMDQRSTSLDLETYIVSIIAAA
jgi:hypothetical protein